jgi:hypothetical protein
MGIYWRREWALVKIFDGIEMIVAERWKGFGKLSTSSRDLDRC